MLVEEEEEMVGGWLEGGWRVVGGWLEVVESDRRWWGEKEIFHQINVLLHDDVLPLKASSWLLMPALRQKSVIRSMNSSTLSRVTSLSPPPGTRSTASKPKI